MIHNNGKLTDALREAIEAYLEYQNDYDWYLYEAICDYDLEEVKLWMANNRPDALADLVKEEHGA